MKATRRRRPTQCRAPRCGPFTVPEIAHRNRIGPKGVYRAIRQGDLRAARLNGRDFIITVEWEHAWLERQAQVHAPAEAAAP